MERIDWSTVALGVESDGALAVQLGCDRSRVRRARQRRQIAAVPPTRRHVQWYLEPLGVETDHAIARRLGVDVHAVQAARRRRSIPLAPPSARTRRGAVARGPLPRPAQAAVVAVMATRSGAWRLRELWDVVRPRCSVGEAVRALVRAGVVERVEHGRYALCAP